MNKNRESINIECPAGSYKPEILLSKEALVSNGFLNNPTSHALTILFLGFIFFFSQSLFAHNGTDHIVEDEQAALLAQNYSPFNVSAELIQAPALSELHQKGSWGPVIQWPHIPVSAANLPDGRVLTWASNQPNAFPGGVEYTYATVWDPQNNTFLDVPHDSHDMFCSHQVVLEDGRVFVNGGRNHVQTTSVFNADTNTWSTIEPMNMGRWYPTSIALSDGGVLTSIGSSGGRYPEVWRPGQGWTLLTGIDLQNPILDFTSHYEQNWWPYVSIAPDGSVVHYGPTPNMHRLNTSGNGNITNLGQLTQNWYPKHGASVVYDEGKIILAGGAISGSNQASSNKTLLIDINGQTPIVSEISPMLHSRKFQNAIALPNGEVFMVGGNTSGIKFNDTGTVLAGEIWNPNTQAWRETASMSVPRNYHSVALLLTDGRVLSGGGGLCGGCNANHLDAQVFSPPYLFDTQGNLAVRPQIQSAPKAINNGHVFDVNATPGIVKFSLVKMSSTTHAVNTDARFINVPFTENASGQYHLTSHSNVNVLTPGYYMLFALNVQGVPSIAEVVQVNKTVVPENFVPVITQLEKQNNTLNDSINLQILATDRDGDVLSYAANNLPDGLSIDNTSGLITGSPNAVTQNIVTITVTDTKNAAATMSFEWNVTSFQTGTGNILREWWTGIGGNPITNLTSNTNYPDNPSGSDLLTSFEAPTNWADNYGTRIRGYIYPPVSGDYIFWISTDDYGQLLLSSNSDSNNATQIAHVPGWSSSRQWNKYAQQQSQVISLQAGVPYYIEALQKEGGGGDNLAVAWQIPGNSGPIVIAGTFLSPLVNSVPNQVPTLTNPGTQNSFTGDNINLTIQAIDQDGDTLSYNASTLPPGLSINTSTGLISGTVSIAGSYTVIITVNDGNGGIDNTSFVWDVSDIANQVPVLTQPIDQSNIKGDNVTLLIGANDQDGDTLTFNATGLPSGLSINSNTGTISGTVTTTGTSNVSVTVSDGNGGNASASFNWVVTEPNNNTAIGEVGNITVSQSDSNQWHTVALNNNYLSAVVVMGPPSYNGGDASTIRVQNVTANSFQFQIDEWDYKAPGGHASETISYMVIEAGIHNLPNGTNMVAGRIDAINQDWHTQSYGISFSQTPVVLSQTTTRNDPTAVVTRQRNINNSQFQLRLQEEENSDGIHSNEQVHWIAIDNAVSDTDFKTGRTSNSVTHNWYTVNFGQNVNAPVLLAAMQTFDGSDTASLRYRNLVSGSTEIFVEEEQSANSEVRHTTELVGYVALSSVDSGSLYLTRVDIPTPNNAPVVTNPGNQTHEINSPLNLTIDASDADGDPITFSATGLPPGLLLDSAMGIITGTPSTAGNYTIQIEVADDKGGSVNTTFTWIIINPVIIPINVTPITTTSEQINTGVTYQANASGDGSLQYKWNFGDGSAETNWFTTTSINHTFTTPGRFIGTLTVKDNNGQTVNTKFIQAIHQPLTTSDPTTSMSIVYELRNGIERIWNVNPDNDSVTVFDINSDSKLTEINVGDEPRSLAIAPDQRVWVINKQSANISVINPDTFAVETTLPLSSGSQPYGIVFDSAENTAYIALEAQGLIKKLNASSGQELASLDVGKDVRHLALSHDGMQLFASRFITPPLPDEASAAPLTIVGNVHFGGEVLLIDTTDLSITKTIILQHSEIPDAANSGRGIPNYLGATAISPDGLSAWVPSKQDNIKRGTLRDGNPLTHDSAVRSITSKIILPNATEDLQARIDSDDAGIASSAAFGPFGNYLYITLEGSREVAMINVFSGEEIARFDTGRAPQGLVLSPDGLTLYVHNFMQRSVSIFDLSELQTQVNGTILLLTSYNTVDNEKLTPSVFLGKQHFYDAKDPKLALEKYLSCASCHNEGDDDGRTWDFTGFGEGLRNTIDLRGRAGTKHGPLHWTANFDEVQDFEGQIRNFSVGAGLMSDADFHAGTRSEPLGDSKAGISTDLDALATYVASLDQFTRSPYRNADGSLTSEAISGRDIFRTENCNQCHSGDNFTDSKVNNLHDIGTLKPSSGNRLNNTLTGIDTPTLRGIWSTAPYLHDGSADTLSAAITAHSDLNLTNDSVQKLSSYLLQIDGLEPAASQQYRYVRFVAESEVNGNPWTSVAEFNVLDENQNQIQRNNWSISTNSEELVGENGRAINTIDGIINTIWHTEWYQTNSVHPHQITIDMGQAHTVTGFSYLPRQSGPINGTIKDYKFYLSVDGINWGAPVSQGQFANDRTEKIVEVVYN